MSIPPAGKRASNAPVYALMTLGVMLIAAGVITLLPVLADVAVSTQAPEDFNVAGLPAPSVPGIAAPAATPAAAPVATAPAAATPGASAAPMPLRASDADAQAKLAISGAPLAMAPQKSAPKVAAPKPILGFETPRRIVIPAIKLNAPVEETDFVVQPGKDAGYWEVPDRAAGWHSNSALLGEVGNLVMSGHNNLGTRVFANLRLLKPNDEIIVQGETYQQRYTVVERKLLLELGQPAEVQAQNARYILPDLGDTRLTLVTCWPPTGNSHRIIVIAKPVGEPAKPTS